jgi:L-lactate dehydrogenase complex protein LldG
VSAAREEVLARIRAALADRPGPVAVPRSYRAGGTLDRAAVVSRFVERVADYRASVEVTADPAAAATRALREQGARRIVVASDLPSELRPDGVELVVDEGLEPGALDRLDGALTTCAAACADTGTIALDGGPGQGRRAVTLVPDLHVCVVEAVRIVETVPELVARLAASAREGRPIVLVSGPSATSDIELDRVEGVHGPRRLVVLVHDPASVAAPPTLSPTGV